MKNKITSIAIGGFDGMHLAHQELFKYLCKNGAVVAIETSYANLTPGIFRQRYINYPVFYYPLKDIKNLSGEEFIKLLKEEFINLKKIVIGYDFRFGKDAKYDSNDLKKFFDGEVVVVEEFKIDNISVHSRVIREFLIQGEIKKANRFLGHNYLISGNIIKGQGIGHKELVPTINIEVKKFLIPAFGVYASFSYVDGKKYLSATFVGNRTSLDNQFAVETHIIDKEITPVKKQIEIEFIEKIRDITKFDSLKELKKRIELDITIIKNIFIKQVC